MKWRVGDIFVGYTHSPFVIVAASEGIYIGQYLTSMKRDPFNMLGMNKNTILAKDCWRGNIDSPLFRLVVS